MRGHKDFIVHIPEKYKDGIQTKGGATIHLDRRFNAKQVINTIVEVVSTPVIYDGVIKEGFNLLVDPTLLMNQTYTRTGEQENINLVDRDKQLYKVDPSLIIAYQEKGVDKWQGFQDNVILARIKPVQKELKKIGSIFIPDVAKPKDRKHVLEVLVANDEAAEMGMAHGDHVVVNIKYAIDMKFGDRDVVWLKNKFIHGVELKEAV